MKLAVLGGVCFMRMICFCGFFLPDDLSLGTFFRYVGQKCHDGHDELVMYRRRTLKYQGIDTRSINAECFDKL